jgi:hypothetical protein
MRYMEKIKEEKQRTAKQNRALHKFFSQLSIELNTAGLDMRIVLKPSYQLWWTPKMVKEHLWKSVQEAMYQKKSTTELTTKELDKIFEQLQHILGEKFGLELEFPSIENLINYEK